MLTTALYSFCLFYALERKMVFKEIIHFQCFTEIVTPEHRKPCLRSREIYDFGRDVHAQHT